MTLPLSIRFPVEPPSMSTPSCLLGTFVAAAASTPILFPLHEVFAGRGDTATPLWKLPEMTLPLMTSFFAVPLSRTTPSLSFDVIVLPST